MIFQDDTNLDFRERSSAIDLNELSDNEGSDEESELKRFAAHSFLSLSIFRREKARSRRVTTIGEEGDSKLSIEEFHQKLTWERWSGNGHLISPEAGRSPPSLSPS